MGNYQTGHYAEQVAAEHLASIGYTIREINWRIPRCEIDIVAENDKKIYFFEVKYRRTLGQGSGFEYITSKKLRQMSFAAEMWVAEHGWGGDYCLSAIEITGEQYIITSVLIDL